ncbi:cell wall-binding repeat-containing protein [Brevibacillus centrosporus]|uniref:cell wall-binding repeat-containing protein n=1 Tax=Brevibacillus centrosporus TaxID=54910 RepID=UPI0039885A78
MKIKKFAGIICLTSALLVAGCTSAVPEKSPSRNQPTGSQLENKIPWVATKNTTRINTSDPFEAAVIVSKTIWTSTNDQSRPGGVVLVNPDDWQSALVSTDLIHFPNNGPVLFSRQDQIPDVTINELKRLNPIGSPQNQNIQVILVGNFDKNVEEQIKSLEFKFDRIQGKNPADYAKAIDAYYAKVAGSVPQSVIIGSMDSPDFTLPATNWIAHMPEPLLYVKKDEIPQETNDALKTRNGQANIYLLGPELVVSSNVEQQLKQYGKVTRISGNDPYENAIAFAKFKDSATQFGWGITSPGHNVSFMVIGSPALAIAQTPFSHMGKHAPLLWTGQDKMPSPVMSYLMSIQPKYKLSPAEGPYNHAWITGDQNTMTSNAQAEIDSMLEITSESGGGHGNMGGMDNNKQTDSTQMPGMKH